MLSDCHTRCVTGLSRLSLNFHRDRKVNGELVTHKVCSFGLQYANIPNYLFIFQLTVLSRLQDSHHMQQWRGKQISCHLKATVLPATILYSTTWCQLCWVFVGTFQEMAGIYFEERAEQSYGGLCCWPWQVSYGYKVCEWECVYFPLFLPQVICESGHLPACWYG